ncbi:MAG: DUF4038 domain-containing protein [Chitinophagaceae bacterium]
MKFLIRFSPLQFIFLLLLASLSPATGHPQGRNSTVVFPIKASENKRYFVDQEGLPFFYHAETGWQIFTKLTTEEALEYLQARRAQGFNAVQTQLATTPKDVNRYNQRPFHNDNDFSQPNEAYYDHIKGIVAKADSLGLLIVISAPWLDCCRGGFGMGAEKPYQKNGTLKSLEYGKYLGNTFKQFKNIMWIMGGDNDPGQDRQSIEQLAIGLKETAPHQMITYHAAATHSSTDLFHYASWLDFSMVYTYWRHKSNIWLPSDQVPEVYEVCLKEYNKSDHMPFILGEAQYEGSSGNNAGTPDQVRRQAYWTMLSGGSGHAYGSEIYGFPANWREKLKNPGARQMEYFIDIFNTLPWWQLIPDQKHQFVSKGFGEYGKLNYVTAAVTGDKRLAVIYMTSRQTITVDLAKLVGSTIETAWYNPRDGMLITAGTFSKKTMHTFIPPAVGDWVLLFKDSLYDLMMFVR